MKTNKKTEVKLMEVYAVIENLIKKNNFPPTLRELMTEINVNSTSTVKYYLDKLEEKGLIKRNGNENRALELTNQIIIKR